jgi:hypothetical protein
MRCRTRAASAAILWTLAWGHATAAAPLPAFDAATDRVVQRTVVPDDVRHQGEVRLVARGDAVVVQTLLATKVLRRVVSEIRKKEERNWPADRAGHDDMVRYVGALAAVASELETAHPDERQRLLIELVATADGGGIVIGEFEGGEADGALRPTSARTLATPIVGREYVLRNMRLILADSFDLDESEVDRLGPLGPAGR